MKAATAYCVPKVSRQLRQQEEADIILLQKWKKANSNQRLNLFAFDKVSAFVCCFLYIKNNVIII